MLLQNIKDRIHNFFNPESEAKIRTLQIFWVVCGGLLLLVVSYGLVTFLYSSGPLAVEEKKQATPTRFETALSKVDTGDAWRFKIEQGLEKLGQKTEGLEKLLLEDMKTGDFPHPATSEEERLERGLQNTPQSQVSNQLQELESKILQIEMKIADQRPQDHSFPSPQAGESHQEGAGIQKVTLGLSEGPNSQLKTVETTIPAGAFAKTVLISGLDASASMTASSDPRPLLLRIIDPGTLPRRFQSDLKDCHCTASAYGDLSSERVYGRLEKLSCIERATGKIIETQVAGYIAGGDGKAGVRGIVASKDGQFLGRSLVGGFFAGLSNVANPQNRQPVSNPFSPGGTASPPSMGTMFASGMATGATTALDRLSQYYIDRAEQLQPVIQIAAGQVVDIVFTEGTFIGSETIRHEIENTRNEVRENIRKPIMSHQKKETGE